MGPLSLWDNLFKPRFHNKELIVGEHIRPIMDPTYKYDYIKDDILYAEYPESYNIQPLDINLSTICSETGSIKPLEHYIIDTVYYKYIKSSSSPAVIAIPT
jgi:hypothetical protein